MHSQLWHILGCIAFILAAVTAIMPVIGKTSWHFWIATGIVLWLVPVVFA